MPNIEFIPLSLVDDYDKNSNTHPRAQIENIKAQQAKIKKLCP